MESVVYFLLWAGLIFLSNLLPEIDPRTSPPSLVPRDFDKEPP